MKRFMKQIGQGMTEYIIIVALIAISAIGIYSIFGDTITDQMGTMTRELAGGTGVVQAVDTQITTAETKRNLGTYVDQE
jgi:type IV pilus assembly protein PilA